MPTQVYECARDGEFDVTVSFNDNVPRTRTCPTCRKKSKHVLKPPAGIKIVRGWNERANDFRRDPYTQAKAQLDNAYNESKEMGMETGKPTEKSYQSMAANIDKKKKRGK